MIWMACYIIAGISHHGGYHINVGIVYHMSGILNQCGDITLLRKYYIIYQGIFVETSHDIRDIVSYGEDITF